ncbi:MAG: 3-hydroxyacyl-[acyl-carrier-protein] dehydratase FabZ [Acidobacteriia bacterium]|nr:3-hydroxyacyl-[acyl-carrier-protein] dehydratase FabZ [Terriglobia bacterium]
MPKLTHTEIEQILPHRHPFLFVDEVEDYELGKRITGHKMFSAGDFMVQDGGGFVPEAILIEASAQVGAVLILKDPQYAGRIPFFMGIESMVFHRRVRVGEAIRFVETIEKIRGPFGVLSGKAWVGEELVAEATMRVALGDRTALTSNHTAL